MCQLQEILFDKLDSFNTFYLDYQKLVKKNANHDFDSICLQEDKTHDTETATLIVDHVQLSLSFSSDLIEKPISLCNINPGALVESLVDALEKLAIQSKAQVKLKFREIENSVKIETSWNWIMKLDNERFDDRENLKNTQFPPYENVATNVPLKKTIETLKKIKDGGLTSEKVLSKSKLKQLPAIGQKTINTWPVCGNKNICVHSKTFALVKLQGCCSYARSYAKDSWLFDNYKGIDKLKLRCTLPNLANICFHKSTTMRLVHNLQDRSFC